MLYQILSGILAAAVIALSIALVLLVMRNRQLRVALDRTSELAGAAQKSAVELGELAKLHARRATEFFGIIEGVERERDDWQAFYRNSSRAAGVAQGWLARELQRVVTEANGLGSELKKLGKQVRVIEVDPALTGVLEDFNVHSEGKNEVPHAEGMAAAQRLEDGRAASGERAPSVG
jgi:hypothetical protein